MPADGGGSHVVVVALLQDMGNNSAAITATRLLSDFKGVQHLIMCGIAGGVPRPGDTEHDVRLGDIVVSDRGGVVQYDLIKKRPDASKEHRHPPRPPGAALLGAVGHLRTEEERGSRPSKALLALGKIKGGKRPADDRDAHGDVISYPPDSGRTAGQPRVFHGTIASANILLKNAAHRDYLGKTFSVKAIEMQGSAFLRRCLVLQLALPVDRSALVAFLVGRGRAHYEDRCGDAVLLRAAEMVASDRLEMRSREVAAPGLAEYVDLVGVAVEQATTDAARLKLLDRVRKFALRKHPEEPAS